LARSSKRLLTALSGALSASDYSRVTHRENTAKFPAFRLCLTRGF
jgi:hypothetical protein